MNDQDPLAQLRDIHVPEAVGLWPPAPGWWLLAAIILAAIVVTIVWRYRLYKNNRYRGEASKNLDVAWKCFLENKDAQAYILQLTQVLKRTALTAYPKLPINRMSGNQWLSFLDTTMPSSSNLFCSGPGKQLLDLPYQPPQRKNVDALNSELKPLHKLCKQWIKEHRPQSSVAKKLKSQPQSKLIGASASGVNHAAT